MNRRSLSLSMSWFAIPLLTATGIAMAQEGEPTGGPTLREPGEVFREREEEIETDRDSFTPATTVVAPRRVLVESSYSFTDYREGVDSHSFPELLARIGIIENVEFRIGWNYEIAGIDAVNPSGLPGPAVGEEEEGTLLYGLKVSLTEQDRWLPQSAFIVQAFTPTAGPDTVTQFTGAYVFGWTLPQKWKLDSSLRYAAATEEAEEDHFNVWSPSVVLKIPVSEKWNAHVEYFGVFTDQRENERAAQYFSPGVHYLITPDIEIGVRLGWGLNRDSANFFSNLGAGVQF